MIAAIVILMTVVVVAVSLALPESYTATARLVFEDAASALAPRTTRPPPAAARDHRAAAHLAAGARRAAKQIPGVDSGDDLAGKVTSSVEQDANIINISATDEDPEQAARIANSVGAGVPVGAGAARSWAHSPSPPAARGRDPRLEGSPNADVQIGAISDRIWSWP